MNFQHLLTLPIYGVGIGPDIADDPRDYDELLQKCAAVGFDYIEVGSDGDVARVEEWLARTKPQVPLLHHNPVRHVGAPEPFTAEDVEPSKRIIELLGTPWSVEETITCWMRLGGVSDQIPMICTDEAARVLAEKVTWIQNYCQSYILPEFSAFDYVVGDMELGPFLHRLCELADCGLVLDLGHLFGYAACVGVSAQELLSTLPMDRFIELHIAGGSYSQRGDVQVYTDAHGNGDLPAVMMEIVPDVIRLAPNLKAVTLEIEHRESSAAARDLAWVRDVCQPFLARKEAAEGKGAL